MWHVGWFVDMFEITEASGEKVVDPQKLKYIQQMLNVHTLEENYALSSGTLLDNSLPPSDRSCLESVTAASFSEELVPFLALYCMDMFSCKVSYITARFCSRRCGLGMREQGYTADLPVTDIGVAGMLDECHSMETTVFELAGQDRAGMLADITDLLSANDCIVRSAAVSASASLTIDFFTRSNKYNQSHLRPHPRFGLCIKHFAEITSFQAKAFW